MTFGHGSFRVGTDGKVPIPTIYLGMTRMLPIGETEPASVRTAKVRNFDHDDREGHFGFHSFRDRVF